MTIKTRNRVYLILLLLCFFLPVFFASLIYQSGYFTSNKNTGDLLEPFFLELHNISYDFPLPYGANPSALDKQWSLLGSFSQRCDALCVRKLYIMRQLYLAQGLNRMRMHRFIVMSADAKARLEPSSYLSLEELQTLQDCIKGALYSYSIEEESSLKNDFLYLRDPNGFIVMRWQMNLSPTKILRDISMILKFSKVG